MAGYPKIWTTLLSEDWFVPLSLNAKGLYLWLIIEAKRQGDTGAVMLTGWSSLAEQVQANRQTVADIVRKFHHIGKVLIVEKRARVLHLQIANYDKYQTLKTYSPRRVSQKLVSKNRQQPITRPNNLKTGQPKEKIIKSGGVENSADATSECQSAYFKRFGKKLGKADEESLLKIYGDKHLLLLMIQHITLNNKIESPVGLLIVARSAPGSHLPDDQYDNWKREQRNVFSRNR